MIPRPISIAFRPPSITASHSAQGAAWRELEACALPDHHGYSGAVLLRGWAMWRGWGVVQMCELFLPRTAAINLYLFPRGSSSPTVN
ncbi:hypothetical protein FIBSPDRAFT_337948 [Athelia psychrophila]|uniref:Uncharacterized protein n=1 Tax=Athelia psychrophila TaxID=1759441 RepID=A0A167WC26_9AGAM|nr:hypothetical protein FIBSPDRAFT_337948 [Fibularhizoctonia sp. CBS 109695]